MTNGLKPVAYLEVEPSAKGLPAEEIIKHAIMFSTRWHFPSNKPEVFSNPIHVFYSQQQVDQLQAQIEKLTDFVREIKGQIPEKPDYWSSCGQCERNSSNADDLLDDIIAYRVVKP